VHKTEIRSLWAFVLFVCVAASTPTASLAQTGLKKVNHIIIVMQENHSFDNYFGALPYPPGTPYHNPSGTDGCALSDHGCVDGLSCMTDATGSLHCFNANLEDNGSQVFSFHETSRCPAPQMVP
jgi:phospholipase C